MEKAVDLSGIDVDIIPKAETMKRLYQPDLKFGYGSLHQKEYLNDLEDAICRAIMDGNASLSN